MKQKLYLVPQFSCLTSYFSINLDFKIQVLMDTGIKGLKSSSDKGIRGQKHEYWNQLTEAACWPAVQKETHTQKGTIFPDLRCRLSEWTQIPWRGSGPGEGGWGPLSINRNALWEPHTPSLSCEHGSTASPRLPSSQVRKLSAKFSLSF